MVTGDVRALALIHATRVLVIITLAPIIMTFFYGANLSAPLSDSALNLPSVELALMAAAALIGWKVVTSSLNHWFFYMTFQGVNWGDAGVRIWARSGQRLVELGFR